MRVVHGSAGPVLAGPNDVVPSEAAVLRAPESAESMREEVATAAAALCMEFARRTLVD